MTKPRVFVSYSYKDEKEKDILLKHLGVLQRADLIKVWSDDLIPAGANEEDEICKAIAQAKVAILLISANFLSSPGFQVQELLRRHKSEELVILSVIAKACAWRTVKWLTEINNIRPRNGQPVWSDAGCHVDEDLADIAEEVAALVGLNVGDVVDKLRQKLPRGDSRPEQLRSLLNQFRKRHEELYEWKELHNNLNKILSDFGQYVKQIERFAVTAKPLDLDSLALTWRPVYQEVEKLLQWAAQDIEHIGRKYEVLNDGRMVGEDWAVELRSLSNDIDTFFRHRVYSNVLQRIRYMLGSNTTWHDLYNLTTEFDNAINRHMYYADRKLRQTATELCDLSKALLR